MANGDDCDDANPQSSPASYEICDGTDNDCDGTVDNDPLDATDWYADADGDGYGDASSSTTSCDAPTGFVADFSDCDDASAAVSPGATEACDGTDNDCDGATDEADAYDTSTWYTDADGDSYGDSSSSTIACSQPGGNVLLAGDCNDADSAINPGAAEVCDGIDNDCNGTADGSDASDATNWYLDGDSDGYGLDTSTVAACSQPGGYVAVGGDCDDADSATSPGATEACDAVDNDCNGLVDDQALGIAEACAAADCNAILADMPGIADGNYWVDPEEDGVGAFEVYCDMTTGGGGWTLLLNLDTSDGHVMWWNNDLWTDTDTYGDVGTPFSGDHKNQAYMDLDAGSRILVLVHENGSIVGWKSFDRATSSSLYDAMQGGDNTLIGASVADSDTANVWSQERLVNDSTSLYANHCLNQGSSCVNASGSGHSDGDRIASDESTPSGDNGGGLGNWHDMRYCCGGQTYAGHSCNGAAFRTTSEAQAGWSYSTQGGTFGSDSFGTMTGTETDSTGCSNANWAEANGFDYDYAVFFGQ